MPLKRTALKLARKLGCMGSQEPEEEAAPIAIQPDPVPDEAEVVEPGRPYQDFAESEARKYWREINKAGSLVKPTTLNLFDVLPIRQDAKLRAEARNRYVAAETDAMQPRTEPDASLTKEPGRPYQAYVEDEARRYWQETVKGHNLAKPTQEEIRTATMPVLCLALRNRTGHRRHQAVVGMVQHALEKGWIRRPSFSEAYESPSYSDALIQLADEVNWLAREIPLPDHPPPRHPPIYYTIGSRYGRPVPVPREDAVIRGDYLNKKDGSRFTEESHIYPIAFLPGSDWRLTRTSIISPLTEMTVINRHHLDNFSPVYYGLTFERARKPTNRRGVYVWFDWEEEAGRKLNCFSSQLRDFPYPSDLVFSRFPPTP